MDAVSLRGVLLKSKAASEIKSLTIGIVNHGEYSSQGGNFDIHTESLILAVCTWTNNTVEIQVINRDSGETVEIKTLENTNESEASKAIYDSIKKNT